MYLHAEYKCMLEPVGLTEVWVLHGFPGCEASLMVITQKLVQKVQGFSTDQVLVLTVHKPLPPLPGMSGGKKAWNGFNLKNYKTRILIHCT